MYDKNKTQRGIIINKGNYGIFNKTLGKNLGLESAVILDFLLSKYDYFVDQKNDYKMIGGKKAFFITQTDLLEGTCIKPRRFTRETRSNPLVILEKNKLIERKVIREDGRGKTYFLLNLKIIDKATG